MSLTTLPVTASDLTTLQSGVQFFINPTEAANEATAINTPGSTETVFTYAARLIQSNISLSQVAMAVSALMEGGTIAVGNTTTPNTLTFLSTQFLPGQVAVALANNFNPTVFAAESLGSALSTQASFNTQFVGLSVSQFSQAVSTATGVNVNAIQQFVTNWQNFFTANPAALQGRTVTQASYGAAFGDAVGVALLNPTSAQLQTQVSTNPAFPFSPNTITGQVANALIDIAEGSYKVGVPLASQPAHQLLQGEAGVNPGTFNLTPSVDTFNSTFANTVFNALPAAGTLGLTNTLNTGDTLTTTDGKGTLNLIEVPATLGILANPPFATGVTINGVNTLNVTNTAAVLGFGFVGGFAGKVTGLTTVNDTGSLGTVQLGQLGQGLNTLLTNVNISGYAPQSAGIVGGTAIFAGIVAAAAADLTKTIAIDIKGTQGTTKLGGANTLIFSNDVGGGTAAAPNNSYGTWAITADSKSNLVLQQDFAGFVAGAAFAPIAGGVGGATGITLAGKGDVALGQDAVGNWRLLKSIDAAASSGNIFITGATAGNGTNAFGSTGNPLWLFGAAAGLLDDTGTGTFNLTSYKLSSGSNTLDVSSATAAQVAKLVTTPNATASLNNTIIVQDSVATTLTADTFKGIVGFQTLGIGGPTKAQGAAGTIDMKLMPGFTGITYFTAANGSVNIINSVAGLTVNVEDNTTAAQNLTIGGPIPPSTTPTGPTGLNDALTVIVGNALHNDFPGKGGDALGDITAFGYELVTLTSKGGGQVGPGTADSLGGTLLVPTLGGNEQVTIGGDTTLLMGANTNQGAIQSATGTVAAAGVLLLNNLSVTITNTAETVWGQGLAGTLLNFATGGGPATAYSNNAVLINASTSGGLIDPWGDANFQPGATVATSIGDTIIGATNPVGFTPNGAGTTLVGNVFAGSIGNDNLTSNSLNLPDYIVTNGGADKITLAAGHTGADHVGFYSANGNNGGASYAVAGLTDSITVSLGGAEEAHPGWWGVAAGGASTNINVLLVSGTGTSADNSVLTNFNAALDVLDFSAHAWGNAGIINGLSADVGGATKITNVANVAGLTSNAGAPVVVAQVAPGGTIAGTGADFILLNNGNFLNANAVATALTGGSYTINHSNTGAGFEAYDFLLAYQGTDGFAHIADLRIQGGAAGSTNTSAASPAGDFAVQVSDIVTLTGVTLNQLAAGTGGHVHVLT